MRLHIFLGTKAELIKIVGLIRELDRKKIYYNYIHTGQHTKDCEIISDIFGIKKPDFYLVPLKRNLLNIKEMFFWFLKVLRKSISYGEIKKGDIVIVHGDTESTLLGMLIAKMKGARLIHVEGGLRSGHLLNPFPEEIVRRMVDKISYHIFAPGETAKRNALKIKSENKITDTEFNTGWDSLALALNVRPTIKIPKYKYAVLMLHRKETIYVEKKLKHALRIINLISKKIKIIFVISDKTKEVLKKNNLMDPIEKNENIEIIPHQNYVNFVHLMNNSEFCVTDGGTMQEETYFMNKPCLLLRLVTERIEGLGETAFLSHLKIDKIKYFLDNYKKFKRIKEINFKSPSSRIAEKIKNL